MYKAGILGTGFYVPENILTNEELAGRMDTSDEWIRTRTGIRQRRIAPKDMATSDLAVRAGKRALRDAGIAPEDIDLVICATLTPDTIIPATACRVADALGTEHAAAFDLSAACSGFVYGTSVASAFVEQGIYKHVLVIGAETLSRVIDWEDRTTCVLFGDGAGAAVIGAVEEGYGFLGLIEAVTAQAVTHLSFRQAAARCRSRQKILQSASNTLRWTAKRSSALLSRFLARPLKHR